MTTDHRMSPLTAFALGVFGTGAIAIVSGSFIVVYAMQVIDRNAAAVINIAENGVASLPDLVESLPELADTIGGRRSYDYAKQVDVQVRFVKATGEGRVRPVLTITNRGSEVVSTLAVRVAALTNAKVPIQEWTEIVATPIAVADEWRGPLMPGATRHVVLRRSMRFDANETPDGVVEISEVRLWTPHETL